MLSKMTITRFLIAAAAAFIGTFAAVRRAVAFLRDGRSVTGFPDNRRSREGGLLLISPPADGRGFEEHGPEGEYSFVPIEEIKPGCERPLTVRVADGLWLSIAEAAATDYPRTLYSPTGDGGLITETASSISGSLPFLTPWRVFVAGRRAAVDRIVPRPNEHG